MGWTVSSRRGGDGWSYCADTATTIIRLSDVNLDDGLELTVEGVDDRLANGLKETMNRLAKVAECMTLATDCQQLHPDERLGIDLAQAGNRISRQPATFNKEVMRMTRELKRLPAIIEAIAEKGRIGQQGASRAENCDRALAVLESLGSAQE